MVSVTSHFTAERGSARSAPDGAALGAAAQGDAGCAAGSGRFTNSLLGVSSESGSAV